MRVIWPNSPWRRSGAALLCRPHISNQVVSALRAAEHEVLRLKDPMPQESPDLAVIAKAQELGAILLSLNGDFADIVAYPPGQFGGVVALQIHDHPEITPAGWTGSCSTTPPIPASKIMEASYSWLKLIGSG